VLTQQHWKQQAKINNCISLCLGLLGSKKSNGGTASSRQ